jgi:chaperonin GroES
MIRMMGDRLLVMRDRAESVTKGGLFIPEQAKLKSRRGTVVAKGPGRFVEKTGQYLPIVVNVGDHVCFRGIAGEEVVLHGEEYIILREDDLEGVLDD